MKILTTGGAGYIGSHTCLELLEAGFEVVVVDNLSNSKLESLKRVEQITGRSLCFYQVDLLDKEALTSVFRSHGIGHPREGVSPRSHRGHREAICFYLAGRYPPNKRLASI